VSVQGCTLNLPIPLLPLCAVRPVQNLSACTRVHFNFTYTSTPPIFHTACTKPQCLYNGALYLYLYLYSPTYRTACTEPQCLYNGALYLYLYFYSHYVPYGLYRATVPVQRCTLPLPMPLLPLCAVRPVQSLSACTRVHFTFTCTSTPPMCRTACTVPQCLYNGAIYLYIYLYSPYVTYGLYRATVPVQRCTLPFPVPLFPLCTVRPVQSHSARTTVYFTSVPVQRCTLPIPIILLPLCAVRPAQSHSACTTVHFTFTYTSTPTMCRTASTEPKFLYNGALYLRACTTVHFTFSYTYTPPM